jgi:hypothetical protein
MTRGKISVIALGIAGWLLLGLSAGSNAASMHTGQAITPMATVFPRLAPPPPIVGYPPQIYMNPLPPGVVEPSFGSNFGFEDREHRRDFHRFGRRFEGARDR